ncbi:MAG: phosphate ABC transporter permease subunit PstC [Proteobacteria bacterium]|nr:phosphate ABC transporter permease subunit PstC [Pseudomonadota bacterium]
MNIAAPAVAGTAPPPVDHTYRTRLLKRLGRSDSLFRAITFLAALTVLIVLGAIFVSLFISAWPAISKFGLRFFVTEAWNPVTDDFGALAPIYGTIVTSIIAMLIAVPIGLGISVFLTELCPTGLRRPIGIAIELLAGIPSIIYGIWGLFLFAPFLQQHVQPAIIAATGNIPVLNQLFAGPPYGIGLLTASLILAIMVLPFITAVSRDVFETVPPMLKESAYGIGCTTWEVVRRIIVPYTRVGLLGGVMLGLGRALGETMAVTFVIGNAHRIAASILAPGTTISATIANEFTEAIGDVYPAALIELGLILFFITFCVLAVARLMLMRLDKKAGN